MENEKDAFIDLMGQVGVTLVASLRTVVTGEMLEPDIRGYWRDLGDKLYDFLEEDR